MRKVKEVLFWSGVFIAITASDLVADIIKKLW
jgi:hypothetical protein